MLNQSIKAIFILFLLTNIGLLYADRGSIPIHEYDAQVRETSQKAIIFHNFDEEVLILGTDLIADKNTKILEFIPFPSEPQVSLAKGKPLESAIKLIKKLELVFIEEDHGWKDRSQGSSTEVSSIEMRFHAQIGAHDVTVVKINEIEDFGEWVGKFLKEKKLTKGANYHKVENIASDYVKRGIKYFVFDMVNVKQDVRSLKPLIYSFKSKKLYYPLRTSNSFGGKGGIDLIIIAPYKLCNPNLENSYYSYRSLIHYSKNQPLFDNHLCKEELYKKDSDTLRISTFSKISTMDMESIHTHSKRLFPKKDPVFMQLISYYGEYNFNDDIHIDVIAKVQRNILLHALYEEDIKTIKALLNQGVDVVNINTYNAKTALMIASHKNSIELVNLLLKKGANVNAKYTYEGQTALHYAVKLKGNVELVKVLLAKGADIRAEDNKGMTALHYAVQSKGNNEIVKVLLEKGADVNVENDNYKTALHYAIDKGNIEIIKVLLAKGANIHAKSNMILYSDTILHYAVENKGNVELIKLLLDKGANVQAKDNFGMTALHYAVEHKRNKELVELLLVKGADIHAEDSKGLTALEYTIEYKGNKELAKLLLDKGADIHEKDDGGSTILIFAVYKENVEIVKILLEEDVNVNEKNNNGNTALEYAVSNKNIELVKLLLDNGADIYVKDNNGKTALSIAIENGSTEIIRLLKQETVKKQ